MKLKISTLLLALTVVAATGCSNSSNNSQTSGESTTTPATSEQSTDNSGTTSTDMGSEESSMDNSATGTETGSNESTEATDSSSSSSSSESTTASDLTTKDVAKAIEKQGIKLTSQPKDGWVLNDVKPDRYVTSTDAKQAEPVSIYVFDSAADLDKGLKDLETQVNGVPFRKTEYTKGNVLVIYWFEPALNNNSTEKGKLDAEMKKAVDSL